MAATNYTPIQLYYSSTASAAPTAGNLANGELAINITDGKLYYKDNGGVVQVLATKGAGTIGGSTTQIQYNNAGVLAGNAAMTFNNSTNVTTLTTLNLTNALGATYGGTAQSAYTQGDVLYASATNTLSKLGIGTVNYILTSTGSVPQWVAPSSVTVQTANNLAGGAGGSVPYQSAADTTTFLAIGAANRVMTSSGTAPQWVTALTGLTGVSSSSITNTSLTSGRLVYSTTGGLEADSANLTFNGTTLSTTGLSNTGLSTLVKTLTLGDSNFSGVAVFAAATPAKLYIGTGTVTDTTSAIGATNAVGAVSSLAITPIAATNTSVTYTNAATLYIAGAPSAGTNVTLTNPYSLYVAAGAAYFGGAVTVAGSLSLAAVTVTSLTDSGLTSGRVTFASTGGLLADSANLTFNGTILTSAGFSGPLNGTVGATTPATGAFTTVTTTGDLSAVNTIIATNSAASYGNSNNFALFKNSSSAVVGGITHPAVTTLGLWGNTGVKIFNGSSAATTIADFTSTGLAVTGTLSATGTITASSGATGSSIALVTIGTANNTVGGSGNQLLFNYGSNAASRSWKLINDSSAFGDLCILQSTTQTGSSYNTIAQFTSTDFTSNLPITARGGDNVDFTWLKLKSGISAGNVKAINWEDTGGTVLAKDSITFGSGIVTRNFGSFYNSGATTNNILSLNSLGGTLQNYSGHALTPVLYLNNGYGTTGDTTACIRMNLNGGTGGGYLWGYNGDTEWTHNMEYVAATGNVARYTSASQISQTGGNILFYTNTGTTAGVVFTPTERGRFPSTGGFQAVTTISVGNAVPSSSGAGITFPATQSASSDANTLDDYEEGTWTPVLQGSGTAGNFNQSVSTGKYTKVGNMVTLYCAITGGAVTGSPTGDLQITGLPFACAAGTSANGAVQSQALGITQSPVASFSTRGASSILYLSYVTILQASALVQANAVGSSAIVDFCISYPT